jgi:peptidoglycan/xylan/chitin deacetylase (PgdA/CDA1 family)
MSFRSQLGSVRRGLLCALYRRTAALGDHGPIVSFTFDDFPRTAYSTGGAILEANGARGTYYAACGLMNVSNDLGELCVPDDLDSVVARGHELGSQTLHHSSCRAVSLATFRDDVEEGMKAVELVVGHNSTNFAYPYGHVTLRAKKTLGPRITSSRSIIPGFNGPEIDLSLLRANRLYGDVDQSQPIEDLIRQNVKQKTWLIFYTHDVCPSPSEYGCTPELFEFAVSHAVKDSRVLTVEQVLAEIGIETAERHI